MVISGAGEVVGRAVRRGGGERALETGEEEGRMGAERVGEGGWERGSVEGSSEMVCGSGGVRGMWVRSGVISSYINIKTPLAPSDKTSSILVNLKLVQFSCWGWEGTQHPHH
jgi:hypothetical protein